MLRIIPVIAFLGLLFTSLPAQNFYTVKFPDDQTLYGCGISADTVWPVVSQYSCNINVGISVYDQVFYTNESEGCYKIDRRWRIINWCYYNPAWTPWFVLNPPGSDLGPTVNGNSDNHGFLEYHQLIKVIDGVPPVFTDCPASPVIFCDYSGNDPAQYHNNHIDYCEGTVDLHVTATDACSGNDISFRYLLYLDNNNDGVMETFISSSDAGAWPITTTASGDQRTAKVQFPAGVGLPYGKHKIKWIAGDHCGAESECIYEFIVKDCKAPTAVCLHGISVNLMPTGMVAIADTTLLQYTYDNCTPESQIELGFAKAGQSTGVFPAGVHNLTFDCNELGIQEVELWVRDAYGNADYCLTTIAVQDNMGVCQPAGALKGHILSPSQQPVPGATLYLGNSASAPVAKAVTDADGYFQIGGQYAACQYLLLPGCDTLPVAGVNALDALLGLAWIGGYAATSDPLALLAADVDNSGSIDVADVQQIVHTALGIQPGFPAADAWRFVPAGYSFPNLQQPWDAPGALQFCLEAGADFSADFTAVKTGDLNHSAVPGTADRYVAPEIWFTAPDLRFEPGEIVRIPIQTPDLSDLPAFQFTLGYDPAYLQLTGIENDMVPLEYTGLFPAEQRISAAWLEPALLQAAGKNVRGTALTLVMQAQQVGNVSDALFMTNDKADPEVYNTRLEAQAAGLAFVPVSDALQMEPVAPNPASDRISVRWYQPEAGAYALTLRAPDGAPLQTLHGNAGAGTQSMEWTLGAGARSGGVLLLQLEACGQKTVSKVVVLKAH